MQGVVSVSIVPKYILISKLSIPIQLRQISKINNQKQKSNTDNISPIISLFPGDVQSFHFPSKINEKILQIRKLQENGQKSALSDKNKNSRKKNSDNKIFGICGEEESDDENGRNCDLFLSTIFVSSIYFSRNKINSNFFCVVFNIYFYTM